MQKDYTCTMATPRSPLLGAYLFPLYNVGALVRIFSPLLLILLAEYAALGLIAVMDNGLFSLLLTSQQVSVGKFALLWLAMMAITALLFCWTASGLVRWHRYIALNDPPRRLALRPRGRDLRYALRWFIILLLMLPIMMAIMAAAVPLFQMMIAAAQSDLNNPSIPPAKLLLVMTKAQMIYVTLTFSLGSAIAMFLLARKLLFLPMVSIETEQLVQIAKKQWRLPFRLNFAIGAILTTIPLMAAMQFLAYSLQRPLLEKLLTIVPATPATTTSAGEAMQQMQMQLQEMVNTPTYLTLHLALTLIGIYSLIVFPSYLSLYYRDVVREDLVKNYSTDTPSDSRADSWAD